MRGKPQAEEDERLLRVRKKTATTVIRVVLGVVFVFSALVKLNDPLGLTFKIENTSPLSDSASNFLIFWWWMPPGRSLPSN